MSEIWNSSETDYFWLLTKAVSCQALGLTGNVTVLWLVTQASLSTAASEGAACFQVSVAITSPPAMGGQHGDQIMWPTGCVTSFSPCFFPSYHSLQTLMVCSALSTPTPFLYSLEIPNTSLPTLSLNNDPIYLFKGLLSPYKLCRESLQLIPCMETITYLLFQDLKKALYLWDSWLMPGDWRETQLCPFQ